VLLPRRAGRGPRSGGSHAAPALRERDSRRECVHLLRRRLRRAPAESRQLRGHHGPRAVRRARRSGLRLARPPRGRVRVSLLAGVDRAALSAALDEAGADGWLLYDFRGGNPVAARVLGVSGMGTRRLFVLLPREGEPVAVAHRIELQGVDGFPGRVVPYARWEELHAALAWLGAGRTLAMEISPEDAVPYLDRVPFGVVELVRRLGARVVPSGPLVSRFAAAWSAAETAGHLAAGETIAAIARSEVARPVGQLGVTESAVQARVIRALHDHHLVFDHPA